jgi:hypothetical protein
MKHVLDVFELTKFARPAAVGQLPGRMQRSTLIVGEEGDLLEAGFDVRA